MNAPQDSIRWRLATSVGPELVALVLTMLLAVVVLLAVISDGSRGPVPLGQPSPTATAMAPGVQPASPFAMVPAVDAVDVTS